MLAPLLFVALASATAAPAMANSSAMALRPVEQRLELELNPAARTWSGSLFATLEVRDARRQFDLRLAGPTVSRVEMTDGLGRVGLRFGVLGDSVLTVETDRDLATGRASLSVGFDGDWRVAGPGVVRNTARKLVWLERGAGIAFPAWPIGTPETRWTLMVHAPKRYEVRASGRRTGVDAAPGWRTWIYRTSGPVNAESLRVIVRRPARR
jgi:hypothetical protein